MTSASILVVDDNPLNLKLTRLLLEGCGFLVRTASNGQEALELLRTCSPGLILVDLQLPDMDGFELTKALRANPATRDVSIVALTAYAMQGDERRALEAGCDGYIAKPIDTRALADQVSAYLASAAARGARPT